LNARHRRIALLTGASLPALGRSAPCNTAPLGSPLTIGKVRAAKRALAERDCIVWLDEAAELDAIYEIEGGALKRFASGEGIVS
jgi:hypothetical protein